MDQAALHPPQQNEPPARPASMLPLPLHIPVAPHLYGGGSVPLTLHKGITVLLGPNGSGKTHVLRGLKLALQSALDGLAQQSGRPHLKARFLAAGRSAPFEHFRGALTDPGGAHPAPAAVGHTDYRNRRHDFESLVGDMLALRERADLRFKVEARLQALFRRRLRLEWTQSGLVLTLVSPQNEYPANTEASGILHLIGLLAALYDDQVGAILVDEPEISQHPQLQAFLLEEMRRVAGDPVRERGKKIVVLSTHAQGMLPLRRIDDLPSLIFFADVHTAPRQVSPDAGELGRRRLAALVTRLGGSHRAAFFATRVLLVEGPSDEIVVGALAARFDRSLGGSGAEVVPVTGKGEIPETARLFRLMGKRVVVLADLDALADDNALVNAFAEEAGTKAAAIEAGHSKLAAMDGALRTAFASAVSEWWAEIAPLALGHHYLRDADVPAEKASRRAALAALLSAEEAALLRLPHGVEWCALRNRFGALLRALEAGGCFVLRRGTIEDCFRPDTPANTTGKPEAAADEAATFPEAPETDLRQRYADVLRAVERAATAPPIDENAFLRFQLASLLAGVFQVLKPGTGADEIALAAAAHHEAGQLFALENATSECGGAPALRVRITSPLFTRPTFPAIVRRDQNLHAEVERLLS
ncbi:ATP-dependent nuclease [Dankookia rubra]|uniref:ATP-dependent nuclease n=1 Tax=Dankookia rubra TaxID=1442381 RepID=UPI00140A0A22|nr:AAA family ATPase [Dankookia rubra]